MQENNGLVNYDFRNVYSIQQIKSVDVLNGYVVPNYVT